MIFDRVLPKKLKMALGNLLWDQEGLFDGRKNNYPASQTQEILDSPVSWTLGKLCIPGILDTGDSRIPGVPDDGKWA